MKPSADYAHSIKTLYIEHICGLGRSVPPCSQGEGERMGVQECHPTGGDGPRSAWPFYCGIG